jgi:hypothetical protein
MTQALIKVSTFIELSKYHFYTMSERTLQSKNALSLKNGKASEEL